MRFRSKSILPSSSTAATVGPLQRSAIATITILTLLASSLIATPAAAAIQVQFYVDPVVGNDASAGTSINAPLKTLHGAQTKVRAVNTAMTGDIVVNLRGGTYPMTTTLALTTTDRATNGHKIVWQAYGLERPVLDAGTPVTGWAPAGGGIWQATGVTADAPRQLYVNGVRADRARSGGTHTGSQYPASSGSWTHCTSEDWQLQPRCYPDGITLPSTAVLPAWGNTSDMEVVWIGGESNVLWRSYRMPVDTVIAGGTGQSVIKLEQPYYAHALSSSGGDTLPLASKPFYIENAYELLDQPGEFYLNRATDTLSYIPRAGEDMSQAEAFIPSALQTLVSVNGTASQKVTGVEFRGLTFAHTAWDRPTTEGAAAIQASKYINGYGQIGRAHRAINDCPNPHILGSPCVFDPSHDYVIVGGEAEGFKARAAVELNWVQDVVVTGNRFTHLGGAGIDGTQGITETTIDGNSFVDISEAAVVLGRWDHDHLDSGEMQPTDVSISNNWIRQIGAEYANAVAITTFYTDHLTVAHNDIRDVPYSGISSGWGWDKARYADTNRANVIEANHIRDIGRRVIDGGGVYTLGNGKATTDPDSASTRSRITGNVIESNASAWAHGGAIYPDQGSSYYEISNNIDLYGVARWIFAHTNTSHHLTITDNHTDCPTPGAACQLINSQASTVSGTTFGALPPAATAIINAAGLEPGYEAIASADLGTIFVDNGDAGYKETGSWYKSGVGGLWSDSRYSNSPSATATWRPVVETAGQYDTYVWYQNDPGNSAGVPYVVTDSTGSHNVVIDQTSGGGAWVHLGAFSFSAGNAGSVSVSPPAGPPAGGIARADAVKLVPVGASVVIDDKDAGYSEKGTWYESSIGGNGGDSRYSVSAAGIDAATWQPFLREAGTYDVRVWYPSHATNVGGVTYVVRHAGGTSNVTVNQTAGGGTWALLGTYTFAAGDSGKVSLQSKASGQPVRADAVRFDLQ